MATASLAGDREALSRRLQTRATLAHPLDNESRHPENPVIIGASAILIAVGALPALLGYAGVAYLISFDSIRVCDAGAGDCVLVKGPETASAARRVMLVSLLYLPVVLLAMVLDKV